MKATTMTSQPLSLVPENAPFTVEQRAWLNGFFAGMLGAQGGAQAAPAPAESPASTPVEEETPWHDPAIAMNDRLKMAEGRSHPMKLMAAMAQLDCGSCGYLCQTYAQAIADGTDKDLTKCTPGGRDTSKMLKQLQASAPPVQVTVAKKTIAEVKQSGTYDRTNPFSARLLRSDTLNGPNSAKDTRLVVIDLRGSGITYKPGDALGVYPENCPQMVQQIIRRLGATGAEDVLGWDDHVTSFYDALLKDFVITRPSPDLLDLLSRTAGEAAEREELGKLRDSDEGTGDLEIVDLLHRYPSAKPAVGDFIATLSPLGPRLYSISSSHRACPNEVHLTVGAVRYQNSVGRACKGVASTFLAERVRPGQRVRVFVQPSHRFALPDDGSKPIIMVGPGTGIAPFRAFLQERKVANSTGRNWLFYGDQKADSDFLFKEELQDFMAAGTLTKLDTAFSRDQVEKLYVQHRMLENSADLWAWLNEGAHFYVCGDAKRMANDVDKALRKVAATAGGLSAEQVDEFMSNLSRSGRYQRDVY
jgi:sulfite reductase (NADPH) flavoprotein alpha-component